MLFPAHERADQERIANAESKYDLQAQLSAVREDLVRERGARRQAEETVLDMQTKIKEVETQSQELKRLRLVETWVDTSNRTTKEPGSERFEIFSNSRTRLTLMRCWQHIFILSSCLCGAAPFGV